MPYADERSEGKEGMRKSMNVDYIIIQAGGKGTRMDYLTKNKPKSLVPINNLPMMFHLFKKYPEKKYIIIGDYKINVLKRYLETFAKVQYIIVDGSKDKGTCAGIAQALKYIPNKSAFMLIWSDLILPKEYDMPQQNYNYLGISKDFRCRWKYENKQFEEMPSEEYGVAGLFIFKEKNEIINVPQSGEFVRWLQQIKIEFDELPLYKTKEYGLIEEYKKLEQKKCRPFNQITVSGDKIIKEGIDDQGKKLAIREKAWYKHVKEIGFRNIPEIYDIEPLTLEKINGKNIYEYGQCSIDEKIKILENTVSSLKSLHSLEKQEIDYFSIKENYINKTFERLNKVRDLIPYTDKEYIYINGKKCRNVFFYKEQLENKIDELQFGEFNLIHGDCTFSNIMLKNDKEPILIDPRGYFGNTELYGDPAYDWAKLYYSIKGNYDKFNLKKFKLDIEEDGVKLQIESNNWEELENKFFELIGNQISETHIKLIHAIIWLSLTTYAWEDYDSICGAFYNGLYYLEEVL